MAGNNTLPKQSKSPKPSNTQYNDIIDSINQVAKSIMNPNSNINKRIHSFEWDLVIDANMDEMGSINNNMILNNKLLYKVKDISEIIDKVQKLKTIWILSLTDYSITEHLVTDCEYSGVNNQESITMQTIPKNNITSNKYDRFTLSKGMYTNFYSSNSHNVFPSAFNAISLLNNYMEQNKLNDSELNKCLNRIEYYYLNNPEYFIP